MLSNKSLISLTFISLLLWACNRINYFETKPIYPNATIVMAHAATGNTPGIKRNTLEGAIFGLDTLDGIEIDISISKNRGLWLSHDQKVYTLDKYFINVNDETIAAIKDENNLPYYTPLEAVLKHMAQNTPDKTISLEIKYPFTLITTDVFNDVAYNINTLVNQYNLQGRVIVESQSVGLLKKLSEINETIGTYYMCYGNFEKGISRAYSNGLSGFSFDYGRDDELTFQSVALAHELGLKVLTYTINDEYIPIVYSTGADIIQTDNMNFYDLLK